MNQVLAPTVTIILRLPAGLESVPAGAKIATTTVTWYRHILYIYSLPTGQNALADPTQQGASHKRISIRDLWPLLKYFLPVLHIHQTWWLTGEKVLNPIRRRQSLHFPFLRLRSRCGYMATMWRLRRSFRNLWVLHFPRVFLFYILLLTPSPFCGDGTSTPPRTPQSRRLGKGHQACQQGSKGKKVFATRFALNLRLRLLQLLQRTQG